MSGPRVTITLGRSGQVVKKASSMADGSDYVPSSGSKRSVRERLGANVDHPSNKRLRVENGGRRLNGNDTKAYNSGDIRRDDLRYKLMHKSLSYKQISDIERPDPDLREKLLRTNQPSMRYTRAHEYPQESKFTSISRRIPPTRSADDLLHLGSRQTYSSRGIHGFRHRSPGRILRSSRGAISPPISKHGMRTKSALAHVVSPTPSNSSTMMRSTMDVSRGTTFMTRSTVPVESAKLRMGVVPTSTGVVNRTSNSGKAEEPINVPTLLHSLGLGKYAILFQAEEVDMAALRQMGDNDLKELGIPMGPRKKILLAVMRRARQRQV